MGKMSENRMFYNHGHGGDNENYNDSKNVIKTRLLVMIQITMII